MNRLMFAICLFCFVKTTIADPIYVTKDASGNPVFSDKGSETSKQIKVQKTTTYDSSGFLEEYREATSAGEDKPDELEYQTLTVTTPGDEDAIRDNAGNLILSLVIEPGLQPGHTIALVMDGEVHSNVMGTGTLTLENVDRGTHRFHLQVMRTTDKVQLQTGPSTSVSVLRRALPRKAPRAN